MNKTTLEERIYSFSRPSSGKPYCRESTVDLAIKVVEVARKHSYEKLDATPGEYGEIQLLFSKDKRELDIIIEENGLVNIDATIGEEDIFYREAEPFYKAIKHIHNLSGLLCYE